MTQEYIDSRAGAKEAGEAIGKEIPLSVYTDFQEFNSWNIKPARLKENFFSYMRIFESVRGWVGNELIDDEGTEMLYRELVKVWLYPKKADTREWILKSMVLSQYGLKEVAPLHSIQAGELKKRYIKQREKIWEQWINQRNTDLIYNGWIKQVAQGDSAQFSKIFN